jgi:hypothetical protein
VLHLSLHWLVSRSRDLEGHKPADRAAAPLLSSPIASSISRYNDSVLPPSALAVGLCLVPR